MNSLDLFCPLKKIPPFARAWSDPLFAAHTQAVMLRNSRDQTRLLPRLTAAMLRDHYVKELAVMTAAQQASSSYY